MYHDCDVHIKTNFDQHGIFEGLANSGASGVIRAKCPDDEVNLTLSSMCVETVSGTSFLDRNLECKRN